MVSLESETQREKESFVDNLRITYGALCNIVAWVNSQLAAVGGWIPCALMFVFVCVS